MYAQNDNTAPRDPPGTIMRTLLHQMRPWPPAWRRPVEDRPPYAVWVIGGLVVWAFILAGFMVWDLHSTSRTTIWAIFAGWCIGVLGASIARKLYRLGDRQLSDRELRQLRQAPGREGQVVLGWLRLGDLLDPGAGPG